MSNIDLTTYDGPVRTYDGHEAVILDRNMSGDKPILAKVRDKEYKWKSVQVRPDGTMKKGDPFLVPIPTLEQELAAFTDGAYTNIRRRKDGRITCGSLYSTREAAEKRITKNTLLTAGVKIK